MVKSTAIVRVCDVILTVFFSADCISAVQGALCEMQQSDVWLGALWWAAGPWWGDVRNFSLLISVRTIYSRMSSLSTSNRSSPPAVSLSRPSCLKPLNHSCKSEQQTTLVLLCLRIINIAKAGFNRRLRVLVCLSENSIISDSRNLMSDPIGISLPRSVNGRSRAGLEAGTTQ